jgi:hypothetical protein
MSRIFKFCPETVWPFCIRNQQEYDLNTLNFQKLLVFTNFFKNVTFITVIFRLFVV